MCGFIATISKNNKKFSEEVLKGMTAVISHRGPDDEGNLYSGDWLSLGFRRLSILDLSEKGHQPMLSSDGRYAIVFNGEIYNYRELRWDLNAKGYSFISETDTEVVLNAYRHWGEKCIDKFVGMFAFIIADLQERKVFAVRDQLGIKPIFCYEDGDYFIFCSEIKSLLCYRQLKPDFRQLNEYLIFRSVIGRETLFKNVWNLRPGYLCRIENGSYKEEQYFNLASTIKYNYKRSFQETCEEVEEALIKSIKIHLRSDVELGIQLSGGVDSSLVSAIASRESGKKFHSFSISFKESAFYDESEYQRRVSERYGTEHHDYPLGEDKYTELLIKSIWHYEHPLNDPNTVATLHLTEQAKKYITVMLTGEGADESFLGYSRFNPIAIRILKFRYLLYKHPVLRDILFAFWPIKRGKSLFNITRYNPPMYALTYSDLNVMDELIHGEDSFMEFRRNIEKEVNYNVLSQAILQDQICDLQQWFWRADRIGMAASMELRVPYCTVPIFSLANSIPYNQRVYQGERKAVLKKIAEKYIDKDQIYRKKIGFGIPIDEWMDKKTGKYSELFRDTVESESFKNRPFINYKHFKSIYDTYKKGGYREVNCAFLWTYFNLELWFRIFFENGWKKL